MNFAVLNVRIFTLLSVTLRSIKFNYPVLVNLRKAASFLASPSSGLPILKPATASNLENILQKNMNLLFKFFLIEEVQI